jgi:prolyl-tRNA synthetase
MQMSQLVLKTLREAPSEAKARSHQYLLRAGYIRRLSSGIYSYLPLGLRVLAKVSNIVREELDSCGSQEILLPALHPVEIWERSGRIKKMADVLMKVEAKSGDFVLGPTHEEAVIEAVYQDLSSYSDLPATVYQIQTKFRDEPRSRYGLMRTREFIMADAYSFDSDQEGMRSSYSKVYDAYNKIFAKMEIPFEPVEADSGAIGGDVNHEFMSPAEIGEDYYAKCSSCGYRANIEAATRGSKDSDAQGVGFELPELLYHYTPEAPGVEKAVEAISDLGVPTKAHEMLKCLVAIDGDQRLVMLLVPGDREARVPSGMRLLEDPEFERYPYLHKGFIGPMNAKENSIYVVADLSVKERSHFATGGNKAGYHVTGAVLGRDFQVDEYRSLVVVRDGDPCPRCGSALTLIRSVEIGHTFQLGLYYSSILENARFTGPDGQQYPYYMGCYGIGVTRLIAVIAEHFLDDRGLIWPVSVSPYQVVVVPLGAARSKEIEEVAETIYSGLLKDNVEALIDDRKLSPGVSLADCDLIGVPYQVVVGSKSLKEGQVEIKVRRDGTTTKMPIEEVPTRIRELLGRSL